MNTLTEVCGAMAVLQARVQLCTMQAYKAWSAVDGVGLRRGTRPSLDAIKAESNWNEARVALQSQLDVAQPQFAEILALFPAANDDTMNPPGERA